MSRLCWPTLRPKLVADLLAGHSAVALALGALIYLVCLSGTLCVFIGELELWEAPAPRPSAFDPGESDALVAEAIRLAGGPSKVPVVVLRAPTPPQPRTVVTVGSRQWTPGPDGRLAPLRLPFTAFLEALHIDLTLPGPWGETAVGFLGAALFSLLVSGVAAHPRVLRDAFVLRLGGGRRLQEADLHNRIGVWALPFHLLVTLTGAFFGLASLLTVAVGLLGQGGGEGARVLQAFRGPTVAADPRPAPLPPLARVVAQSRALRPGSQLFYFSVARPGTRGAAVTVEVTAPGRLPRGETAVFDARGRRVGRTRFASGDWGLQLYSGAVQVHFGVFGGLPVRLAYGVLGLGLCWVCAGGTSIWLARRRDAGRPAPRLERAWSAWVWGAPLALTLAAAPTGLPPAPVFWLLASAFVVGSQRPGLGAPGPIQAERYSRVALGAGLLATAALRLPAALQSGVALALEALAVLAAAGLLASAWPGRLAALRLHLRPPRC